MRDKKAKEKKRVSGKGRIALLIALPLVAGLFLSFAISTLSSYDQQTTEVVIHKSPLIWRTDGEGDYLLSELAAGGTYELIEAVETGSQIETLTATWEFKGQATLALSANNGQDYTPVVYGVPLTSGFTGGNQLKWRVTLGPDSELSEVRIAYTDTSGAGGTFGSPQLSGFNFRKPLYITNPSGEGLFNYQVKIELEELENIEADFADVRFTATDGETVLAHYLEEIEGTAPNRTATFYVKVPQVPAEGLTLYLYYGNSEAEDISSAEETFDFFDDFTGDALDLDKWQKTGTADISAGQLKLESAELLSKVYQIKDGIIEYRAKAGAGNEIRLILRGEEDVLESADQIAYSSSYEGAEHCIAVGDIVKANQAQAITSGATYDYRVVLQGTSLTFQRYSQDYEQLQAEVTYNDTGGLTSGHIGLKAGAGCTSYFDRVRVRKYAQAEPYISASGDEEAVSLAEFSQTSVAADGDVVLDSTEGAYSLSGAYTTAPLSTLCNITAITPSLRAGEGSAAISIDISADGGLSWEEGCVSGKTYSAPFDFTVGRELLLRANLSTEDTGATPEIEELKLDYSIAPIVTSANMHCSGATGEGGVYISGDEIIVEWDNSAQGDNNPDIISVSCNFEPFGGDAAARMYDDAGDNIYTVEYELPEGINTTTNIFITATNLCGIATRDGHILTVNTTEEEAKPKEKPKNLKKRYKIKFDADEAEIGDFQTEEFRPHVKLKRWGEECSLSIEFPDTGIPRGRKSITSRDGKIEWDSPELGSHFYKKGRREVIKEDVTGKSHTFLINENGGMEFELVLKEVPVSNVVSLPIKAEGLKFYYQAPLTEEEIAQGAVRPDEIEGSYAVYHELKGKRGGGYKTAKAFHIYRPKIIDKNGQETWGELNISEGTLTITIDRTWLNNAAYPVAIDPEFGYTSIGASAISIDNYIRGSIFPTVAREAISVTAYLENTDPGNSHNATFAIYRTSDSSLVGSTAQVSLPPTAKGWYTANFSSFLSLPAGDYAIVAWGDSSILLYYDSGALNQGCAEARAYDGAWPETASFAYDDNKYSIYDDAWYNASWQYRRKITIARAQVVDVATPSTTYADFPVLIYLTGLSNINANGTDIRFTSSDGATELPREIESYSEPTLYAWVKVTLDKDASDTEDQYIYMYYGNTGATEPAATDTYGSQNVWNTNYKMVQHLQESCASGSCRVDSTSNANNGTPYSLTTITDLHTASGQINGADSFDGTDDYLSIPDSADWNIGSGNFTVDMWIKRATTGVEEYPAGQLDSAGANASVSFLLRINSTNIVQFYVGSGATLYTATSTGTITDTNWHHLAGVRDGNTLKLFIDKTPDGTADVTGVTVNDSATVLGIGRGGEYASGNYFNATIDEVRISDTARSAQWIETSYNNQSSPGTFSSAEAEVDVIASFGTASINESETDTATNILTISGGTFTEAAALTPTTHYTITGLPAGVTVASFTVASPAGNTTATLTLAGIPDPILTADATVSAVIKAAALSGTLDSESASFTIADDQIRAAFNITVTLDDSLPTVSSVTTSPTSPAAGDIITFTITFNEDMDTSVAPVVKFGLTDPYTTYTVSAAGGYTSATVWEGTAASADTQTSGDYHLNISAAKDAAGNAMATDTSETFTIAPAADNKLSFSVAPTTPVTAGDTWTSFTVQILDTYDNLTTSTATVAVTTSGGAFSSGTTSKVATAGSASFADLTYNTADTITVTASSDGLTPATSGNVVVNVGSPSKLAFTTQPAEPSGTAEAGVAFDAQPAVSVQDAEGNTITTDSSTQITLSTGGAGVNGADNTDTLYGAATMTVTDGVATFTDLYYNKAETMNIAAIQTTGSAHTTQADFDGGTKDNVMATSGGTLALDSDMTSWTKYAGNPVLDLGVDTTWDDYHVHAPSVLLDGTTYKMWYQGSDDGTANRIGYATSADGIAWTKDASNPVLDLGADTTWDDVIVNVPSVLLDGTTYKMWYGGYDGLNYRIGYATSADGITWDKSASNPVLDLGADTTWDDVYVLAPSVLLDGTTYKMWYQGNDGTNQRIGYATSSDGITWDKSASNPVLNLGADTTWDDYHVNVPSVLLDGTTYKMWYQGYDGTNSRIGYATSSDGITWTKSASNPVLDLGADTTWDDYGVAHSFVLLDGTTYKLWYMGDDGTNRRIGYATADHYTSGSLTSSAINTGAASELKTLTYTADTPTDTTLTIDIRAGSTDTPPAWGTYNADWAEADVLTGVSNGGNITSLGTKQYVQYKVNLATTNTSATPTLDDISVNYLTAGGYTSATSSNVDVGATTANKIVFTSSAQTLTAGVASSAYTVEVRDEYDNLRDADALALNLASSSADGKFDTSAGGDFNGTVTSIDTSGGEGTFYYKDTLKGTPTITVSYTALTDATQQQTVNPAAIASYTVTPVPPATQTDKVAGTGFTETVTAYDAYDNVVTTDSTTVVAMTTTPSGNAKFYPDATYDEVAETYSWTQDEDAEFGAAGSVADGITISGGDVKLDSSSEWLISSLDSVSTICTSIAFDSLGKVYISYIGGSALKYATNATGAWVYTTVDSSVTVAKGTSIAIDSTDKAHILYYTSTGYLAKYATNATGAWVTSTIEDVYTYDVGSIAIDSTDKAHVAYGLSTGVRYATNSTGSWTYETVAPSSVGKYFRYLALDSADKVHISYVADSALNYATNATGAWVTSAVDSVGDVGRDNCIAIDSTDKAHISYYDYTNYSLKYATNATGAWVTSTLDPAGTATSYTFNSSIAIDSTDKAHISYYHHGDADLKYATNATGAWVYTTVDSVENVGYYNSIAIDSNNKPHISYADSTNASLKYAYQAMYQSSGTLESSPEDLGAVKNFTSISWNATTPTGTSVKFQIASNNDNATWNFVGPGGTVDDYYTVSGQKVIGHNGNQYVKYKATLEGDGSDTPTLSDVTITDAPEITAYTLTAGEATIYVKDTVAETITITATDNNTKTGTSGNITVNPTSLNYIVIEDTASSAGSAVADHTMTADEELTVYAAGYDVYDNFIADQSVTWSGTGVCSGNLSPASGTSTVFTAVASGTGTISADDGSGHTDATDTITVNVGELSYITIEDEASSAGSEVTTHAMTTDETLTVYAAGYDADANFIADQSVTWAKTGTLDAVTAGPSTSVTFSPSTAATSGTITADDGATHTDATGDITVSPGQATQLAFTTQPASPSGTAEAGTAFDAQPAVSVQDAEGNTVTSDDSTQITLSVPGAIAPQGTDTLYGTTTMTVTDGVATFTGLYYTKDETMNILAEQLLSASIDFGTETSYTQEDAANGTDFVSGKAKLSNNYYVGTGANGDLVVDGTNAASSTDGIKHDSSNPYIITSTKHYQNVTVQNNGCISTNSLTALQFYVKDTFVIDSSSKVTVDGKGHAGGNGGSQYQAGLTNGYGTGKGYHGSTGGVGAGGAGYATPGQAGGFACSYHGAGGITYGSAQLTADHFGSGGGGGTFSGSYYNVGGDGGAGGGYINIIAENVILGGTISARGENGISGGYAADGGAGSGGSIDIRVKYLTLNGNINAEGGLGTYSQGRTGCKASGDGGVGRIRVNYSVVNGHSYGSAGAINALNAAASPDAGYMTYAIDYPTSQAYYVTTKAGASQIDTSAWTRLAGVSITEDTSAAGTSIKYLVSFDNQTSWKYYSAGWQTASGGLGDLQDYGMTSATLEGLTQAQWETADSFVPATTTTLDFAADLATTDSLATPEIDQIEVNYTTPGGYASATSSNVDVGATTADKIVFTSSAQTLTAGVASSAYTVEVRDEYDNLRDADALALNLASSSADGKFDTSAGGAFDGTVTSTTTSGGVGTFYYKDTLKGTPTITVSYTDLTDGTQQQTVNPAAIASYTVTPEPPATQTDKVAGTGFTETVTAYDVYDNKVTTDSTTVIAMTTTPSGNAKFYPDATYDEVAGTYSWQDTDFAGSTASSTVVSGGNVTLYEVDDGEWYEVDDDLVVVGTATGYLMWPRCLSCAGTSSGNSSSIWATALDYKGYTDWRHPSSVELQQLCANKTYISYYAAWYYSGTPDGTGWIYGVNFSSCALSGINPSGNNHKRAVREGSGSYRPSSGTLESSAENLGAASNFTSISWNATTPAGTSVKFQIASNNDNATWNFVGPDETADTYYTVSGQKVIGHNGNQYVKYKVTLESDGSDTPTLSDVTITDAPEITAYTLSSGTATIYVKDTVAETITITATDNNDKTGTSGNITVNPASLNYIVIEDEASSAGSAVADHTMTADEELTLYAAGYDVHDNYRQDESVTWAVTGDLDSVTAGPSTSVTFAPSTAPTSGTITADHTDIAGTPDDATGTITVNVGALNYITIRDAASGAGNALGAYSVTTGTLTLYAAGYDADDNYIDEQTVTWSGTGVCSGNLAPASGTSTTFTVASAGTGTITADYADAAVTDGLTGTITVVAASEGALEASATLTEPATISSLLDTVDEELDVFDFKITDSGTDGLDLILKKIVITQGGNNNATDWTAYISGAKLTETGGSTEDGTIAAGSIAFGDGTSTIFTVPEGTGNAKTYTLSIWLQSTLPADGDGKIIEFDIDPNDDVTIDTSGSVFAAGDSVTSLSKPVIDVAVSKLVVTGSDTMDAGDSIELTVTAKDANNNIDLDYSGPQSLTFSGLSAIEGNEPVVETTGFNTAFSVSFADGVSAANTLTLTAYEAGSFSVDVTDAVYSSGADDNLDLVISPLTAVKAGLTGPAEVIVAATSDAFTLTSKDTYGNASKVVLTSAFTLTSTTSGTATFLYAGGEVGEVSIVANSSSVNFNYKDTKVSASTTVTATCTTGDMLGLATHQIEVTPAALHHFTISGEPSTTVAGVAFASPDNDITVAAYDIGNNLKTNYTGTITFSSTDEGSSTELPSAYLFTTGVGKDNGTRTFSGTEFTLTKMGSQTITVTDEAAVISKTSNTINVGANVVDHYDITEPVSATAGSNFSVTITPHDVYDNPTTGATVTLSAETAEGTAGGGTLSSAIYGTPPVVDTSGGAVTVTDLQYTKIESIRIKATDGVKSSSFADIANSIVVGPNVVDHYDITEPVSATAGSNFTVTVTPHDVYNNSRTGSATVTLSAETAEGVDGTGTLSSATYSSLVIDTSGGAVTVTDLQYTKAESIRIKATDTIKSSSFADIANSIVVGPADLDHYDITEPVSATAGSNFSVTITPHDVYNNSRTGSATVTLSAETSAGVAGGGTLSSAIYGTPPVVDTSSAGAVTVADLQYTKAESIKIKADDTTYSSSFADIANSIVVGPAAAAYLIITGDAAMTTETDAQGDLLYPNELTITAKDRFANLATGYTGSKSLTFSGLADAPDGTRPRVEDREFGGATSIAFDAGVCAAETEAATLFAYKVEANKVVSATDGIISSTYDAVDYGLTLTVNLPAAPHHFKVRTSADEDSKTMEAGDDGDVENDGVPGLELKVTAYDAYDNRSTNYTGTHDLTFSGPNTSENDYVPEVETVDIYDVSGNPQALTNVNFSAGVSDSASLTLLAYKKETVTVHVTEGALTSSGLSAYGLTLTVTGGDAKILLWDDTSSMQTMAVKDAPWNTFKVNVTDLYGNLTPDTPTVAIVLTEGTLTLEGASVAASAGVATFSDFVCKSSGTIKIQGQSGALTPTTVFPAVDPVTIEDYYKVTWTVKDSVTSAQLPEVTLTVYSAEGVEWGPTQKNGLFEDILLPYKPAGYTFEFEKEGYVSSNRPKTPASSVDSIDGYNNKISWTEYLLSIQEALADYKVISSFVYTEPRYESDGSLTANTDTLNIRIWLERRGKLIVHTDLNKLRSGKVEVYDEVAKGWLTPVTFTAVTAGSDLPDDADPDSASYVADESLRNGVFQRTIETIVTSGGTWDLTSGRTYFAKCSIEWGGATAATKRTYVAGNTFTITISEKLKEIVEDLEKEIVGKLGVEEGETVVGKVETEAEATRTEVTTARDSVKSAVSSAETSIESEVADQATATQTKVTDKAKETMKLLGSADLKAGETLASTLAREAASRILNQESYAKEKETLTIRYKTDTGLKPVISVYDAGNTLRIDEEVMEEKVSASGIYEYDVEFEWGLGEHTIICKETTKGTLDGINIEIISTDLEEISTAVTSTMAQLAGIDTDEMDTLSASIESVNSVISRIVGNIDELSQLSTRIRQLSEQTSTAIYSELELATEKLQEINEGQGVKIERMYDLSEEQSTEVDYIKNKTLEIKALVELSQEILARTGDEPIVKSWLESAPKD